jgi:hypothetical protein
MLCACAGTETAFAQGCSDAGFCSLQSFKPAAGDSSQQTTYQVKLGFFVGQADNDISVFGAYVEGNARLSPQLGLDIRLTTLTQNGNEIVAQGPSDLFVNANYNSSERLKWTLGGKIPLSNASASLNGLPLPMDYQSSLGTWDVIAGVSYSLKRWQFAAAIQQPLVQNENRFVASDYPVDSPLRAFQTTNGYRRSGDAMLRISYPMKLKEGIKLTPGLLPVYHLSNDTYLDENQMEREIEGSQGLTVNGTIHIDYQLSDTHFIQLNGGMPFVVRESRPDGLTRSLIVNLEYRIGF